MSFLATIIRTLLYGWLVALAQIIRGLLRLRLFNPRDHGQLASPNQCVPIDHPAFVRPDPVIYCQRKLLDEGLAVTWDNPDISLFLNGVPVSSSSLLPSTTYEVQARIWNNSTEAPLVDMPVHFSFLSFGIGTESTLIGSTTADVGVKGSSEQPAFTSMSWTTPSTPGHFCLQVLLDPVDDADPSNNLGQENTDVVAAHSPAEFTFILRNDTTLPRRYRFEIDGYAIPARPPCSAATERQALLDRHRAALHPVPAGFQVDIEPATPTLQPLEATEVRVTVEPPAGFVGRQNVNVNAFHERGFGGGVTLTVLKEA